VPTTQRPWPRGKKYASINNFGFGGTNAHAVVEKAPNVPKTVIKGNNHSLATGTKAVPKRLFILSAHDKTSVETQMNDLSLYLEQRPEVFENSLFPNVAYTLGQRRSALSYKVAIPARSSAELISLLSSSETVPSRAVKEPRIGFIFTGQGAQWHGMGRELIDAFPVFATTMERINQCLADMGADFSLLGEWSVFLIVESYLTSM
jgi:acyl transferase domain-containing protein